MQTRSVHVGGELPLQFLLQIGQLIFWVTLTQAKRNLFKMKPFLTDRQGSKNFKNIDIFLHINQKYS